MHEFPAWLSEQRNARALYLERSHEVSYVKGANSGISRLSEYIVLLVCQDVKHFLVGF